MAKVKLEHVTSVYDMLGHVIYGNVRLGQVISC
jgi:hypothetical protein